MPAPRPSHSALDVIARAKAKLATSGARPLAAALSRPRLLRGPHVEAPFDARVLTTPRLVLRAHALRDADAWYELQAHPDVLRFLSWPERTRQESRAHLHDRVRRTRLWQTDDFLALAVERDGRLIGEISLHLRSVPSEVRSVEIGWLLDPRFGGNGYATEAAVATLRAAFDELGVKIVFAVVHVENEHSLRLAERLGFREAHRDRATRLMTLSRWDFLDSIARAPLLRDVLAVMDATAGRR